MSKDNLKRGETALPKNRGSGFEDGYADPPVTPEEHFRERQIYSPQHPLHERIEECIQRFQARRRMNPARSALFSKYLALGGVDTSQRQFTGTAKHIKDWKESGYTADEIREMSANDFLSREQDPKGKFYNPEFPEHWDVDFAGVVSGYLGSYLPQQGGLNSPEIRLAADTILNFLKYVRHHDVCPEYNDNVNEAIHICELALTELPQIARVARLLPGDFNLACRVLFCSTGKPLGGEGPMADDFVMYEDKKVTEYGEMVKVPGAFNTAVIVPANFDSELVFKTTIALHEPDHIPRMNDTSKPIRIINAFEVAYEVKEIVFADEKLVRVYEGITKHDGSLRPVGPVGHVVLLHTIIEDGWDGRQDRGAEPGRPISLYMDNEILEQLREGMKLRLTMCELDFGVKFIKEVSEVLPSFHVFLPQSLMIDWKAPQPNERPPPSVDDPGAADRREKEQLDWEEANVVKEQRKVDPALDKEMRELEDSEALERAMERVKF